MSTSTSYSTRPRALRGAFSRSTMLEFCGARGSSWPCATPFRHSYDPTLPKERPSAKGSMLSILMSTRGSLKLPRGSLLRRLADGDALVGEQLLKFVRLEHLADDIATADELAL